jgi:predicted component of type VI protein secretion system
VSRHRFGEIYAALKVSKNTAASIILKWKKIGTTTTLTRAGRLAKLSNRGIIALLRDVTKNPMVTLTEFLWRWVNLPEEHPSVALHKSGILWESGEMEPTSQ